MKENTRFYEGVQPTERITETLDNLVASSFLAGKWIDIVKADVQGAELLVFAGATKALQQATFVQLEGSTVEYNEGSSCFFEVDVLLRSHGFFLYNIADLQYNEALFKTSGLGQFDMLYAKPTSPRLPNRLQKTKFCGQGRNMFDEVLKLPSIQDMFPMRSPRRARSWISGFLMGFLCCCVMNVFRNTRCRFLLQKKSDK
jgi:Methyltransferase FkbM domain